MMTTGAIDAIPNVLCDIKLPYEPFAEKSAIEPASNDHE